jgi:predicted nucleic acid-binding Zn ribbon protein
MAQPFCPHCGAAQDASNLFCPKCGQRLPARVPGTPPAAAQGEGAAGNETAGPGQSIVSDEIWLRLRAEEQEYTRRSSRRARMGCLVLLILLAVAAIAIWQLGPSGP